MIAPSRRALLDILQRTTREFVAERVGVTRATVDAWCTGRSRPASTVRIKLEANYKIPRDQWGDLSTRVARG